MIIRPKPREYYTKAVLPYDRTIRLPAIVDADGAVIDAAQDVVISWKVGERQTHFSKVAREAYMAGVNAANPGALIRFGERGCQEEE